MTFHPLRVYADTSVFGGVFDREFERPSARFFEEVRQGRFRLVVSPLIEDEISTAPVEVRALLDEMLPLAEPVVLVDEALRLQKAYLRAGVVGSGSMADALHVALASVAECRLIVSWNFKHIVHFDKIPLYNAINVASGYAPIGIHSPAEVIEDVDETV